MGMNLRVLEAFTAGRGPGANLDRWVATDHVAAVLDGVTPKGPQIKEATRSTAAMMDDLEAAIRGLAPETGVDAALAALTAVAARHDGPFHPSAAGALYFHAHRLVVVLSDVWVALDGAARFYPHQFERVLASVRVAVTERELARGRTVDELRAADPGRAAIADLLADERSFRNVDAPGAFFFAAFDGRPIPRRLVTEVPVPPDVRRLVLASDGYPGLGASLEETERALASTVQRDPLMITIAPGTKAVRTDASAFDDRTYLALEV